MLRYGVCTILRGQLPTYSSAGKHNFVQMVETPMAKPESYEHRLREVAKRQGLILQRSRRRDPQALDYGLWWLLDAQTRERRWPTGKKLGVETLEEVERFLAMRTK